MQLNYHEMIEEWKRLLGTGLSEDSALFDWTTLGSLKSRDQISRARLMAKEDGVWASEGSLSALMQLANERGLSFVAKSTFRDGDLYKNGDCLAELEGPTSWILALERPWINAGSFVSGIATTTRNFVRKAHSVLPDVRILSTRKTLPGYRALSLHAVLCGGGHPHRISLGAGILIKENHVVAAGGIREAVEQTRSMAPHGLKIEVEVRSLDELNLAIEARADCVLLDNFKSCDVQSALVRTREFRNLFVEVSGGVRLDTLGDFLFPGVHGISVGSLTHSVRSVDWSLLVDL